MFDVHTVSTGAVEVVIIKLPRAANLLKNDIGEGGGVEWAGKRSV